MKLRAKFKVFILIFALLIAFSVILSSTLHIINDINQFGTKPGFLKKADDLKNILKHIKLTDLLIIVGTILIAFQFSVIETYKNCNVCQLLPVKQKVRFNT